MMKSNMLAKKVCFIKLAFSVVLPVLYFVAFTVFKTSDALYIIATLGITFVCAILYLIPFLANIFYLKYTPSSSLKSYILSDLIYVEAPACLSAAITALSFYLAGDGSESYNMLSVALVITFIILSAFSWLAYFIVNKLALRSQKKQSS